MSEYILNDPAPRPEVLSAPLFLHPAPDGVPASAMFGELESRLAEIRQEESELQELLSGRADANGVPAFLGEAVTRRRLELIAAEERFHRSAESLYRGYQARCESRFQEARARRDAVGAELVEALRETGFEVTGINAEYEHSRYGTATRMIMNHPRFKEAEEAFRRWHGERLSWGDSAANESRFAIRCQRTFRQIVDAARVAVGL